MGFKRAMRIRQTQLARPSAFAIFFAAGLMLVSALAAAQDQTTPSQNSRESEGFLATVSRWFRQQTATVISSLEDERKKADASTVRQATQQKRRLRAPKMLRARSRASRR